MQFFAVWEYASRFSAIYATVVDGIAASQIEKDPEARQAEQDLVEQYNQVLQESIMSAFEKNNHHLLCLSTR